MSQAGSCERCGAQLLPDAEPMRPLRPSCGPSYRVLTANPDEPVSAYSGLVAAAVLLSWLSRVRFYVGKIGTGIFTCLLAACLESDGWLTIIAPPAASRITASASLFRAIGVGSPA